MLILYCKIRQKLLLTFVSLLLVVGTGFSQSSSIQYISFSSGLSNSRVQKVIQDSYGLLWIATYDGLNLYDGYKFKSFKNVPGNQESIAENILWDLAEDSLKNIWVATETGVSKYDRIKGTFTNYDFTELIENPVGLHGRTMKILIDSKGRVWAGGIRYGIFKYDNKTDSWNGFDFSNIDTSFTKNSFSISVAACEDNNGKIWFGTDEFGLLYYDEDLQRFEKAEMDSVFSKSITQDDNVISSLYVDVRNTIWISTRGGVYKYNSTTHEIKPIVDYRKDLFTIWTYFNEISNDNNGNIWIANNYRGILKFDGISDDYKVITLPGRGKYKDGSSDLVVQSIMCDRTGIIWFSTVSDGVIKLDQNKELFNHYTHNENDPNSLSINQIFGLYESKRSNKIYVGTRGGGLNLFNPETQAFSQIEYKVSEDNFGGSVRAIYEDDDGTIWLGTWGDGVVRLNPNYKEIERYMYDSLSTNSLPDNLIRNIKDDGMGNLWIGSNDGLSIINKTTKKVKRISNRSFAVYPQNLIDQINSEKGLKEKSSILSVANYADSSKSFEILRPREFLIMSVGEGFTNPEELYDYGWITDNAGKIIWDANGSSKSFYAGGAVKNRISLAVLKLQPGSYKLHYKSDDSHSYNNWNAESTLFANRWGITVFEFTDNNKPKIFEAAIKEASQQLLIEGSNIRSILISKNNIRWIGSDEGGLNKIDLNNNEVAVYKYNPDGESAISDNSVQYIYEDGDYLWLATNNGLNKFNKNTGKSVVYKVEDGLPTNYIASILPGTDGVLWLATRNGLSKMVTDKATGKVTFVNFDANDGLGGNDFIALVALLSRTGVYYFGGEHGLNQFIPIKTKNTKPELVFSDLRIDNLSIANNNVEGITLDKAIYDVTDVTLSYDQNDLEFEFAALHYSKPEKNQYAHILKGYDNEWIFNNKREVTYTNLDPGNYTFEIKGASRDGVWNSEGKSINIKILPPWWFTTWAYISYGALLVALVFGVDRYQRRRLLAKARERMRIQDAEHRVAAAELQAKASEAEKKLMETAFEQKKKELEEARELQLAMLPRDLPNLPNLDIAVYMKTATEVGGDYYDFHVNIDGTLTAVVGDATGHGMRAGTMVTAVKGLFNSYAPNNDILFTFHEMTRCLKNMQFHNLSMCMTMIKLYGNRMTMSGAGMPPIFIYRNDDKTIDEEVFKGMPLGTFSNFPYSIKETTLGSGDTVLMLSDGFPERMNQDKELLGYQSVRNCFEDVAEKEPEEIISHLKDVGDSWANGQDSEDDITFVVMKMK